MRQSFRGGDNHQRLIESAQIHLQTLTFEQRKTVLSGVKVLLSDTCTYALNFTRLAHKRQQMNIWLRVLCVNATTGSFRSNSRTPEPR